MRARGFFLAMLVLLLGSMFTGCSRLSSILSLPQNTYSASDDTPSGSQKDSRKKTERPAADKDRESAATDTGEQATVSAEAEPKPVTDDSGIGRPGPVMIVMGRSTPITGPMAQAAAAGKPYASYEVDEYGIMTEYYYDENGVLRMTVGTGCTPDLGPVEPFQTRLPHPLEDDFLMCLYDADGRLYDYMSFARTGCGPDGRGGPRLIDRGDIEYLSESVMTWTSYEANGTLNGETTVYRDAKGRYSMYSTHYPGGYSIDLEYEYDDADKITAIRSYRTIDSDGLRTERSVINYVWDGDQLLSNAETSAEDGTLRNSSEYSYANGRLTGVVETNHSEQYGSTTMISYDYDEEGHVTEIVREYSGSLSGRKPDYTQMRYDAYGRIVFYAYYEMFGDTIEYPYSCWIYEYDESGYLSVCHDCHDAALNAVLAGVPVQELLNAEKDPQHDYFDPQHDYFFELEDLRYIRNGDSTLRVIYRGEGESFPILYTGYWGDELPDFEDDD